MKSKYIQMLVMCLIGLVLLGILLAAKPAHAADKTDAEVEGVTTFIDTQFGNVCYIVRKRAISCVPLPRE